MASIDVLALETGFLGGSRIRAGTVFKMDVPIRTGRDGDDVYDLPKWVDVATDLTLEVFKANKAKADKKFVDGARAASGTAGANAKAGSFMNALHEGRG